MFVLCVALRCALCCALCCVLRVGLCDDVDCSVSLAYAVLQGSLRCVLIAVALAYWCVVLLFCIALHKYADLLCFVLLLVLFR